MQVTKGRRPRHSWGSDLGFTRKMLMQCGLLRCVLLLFLRWPLHDDLLA